MKTNVGLYIRSNIPGQVASRRRALHAFAKACGWQAIEFVQLGPRPAAAQSLGLGALLAAARDHNIGTIACTSVELLTRSWLASLLDEFRQAKLIVLTESGSRSPRWRRRLLPHIINLFQVSTISLTRAGSIAASVTAGAARPARRCRG